MPVGTYLQNLAERLAERLAQLDAERRARHAAFIMAAQRPDGGFGGRQGGSDLYYTGFALRSLLALDALTPEVATRTAPYLRGTLLQQTSVVDFFSFLYSCLLLQAASGIDVLAGSSADWPERTAAALETFRTPDGGYAKSTGSNAGSTYHTFLVCLCCEMLGRSVPDRDKVIAFILSRQREAGGFVEIAPMKRGGTNPTAAAVGVLHMLEVPAAEVFQNVADFLSTLQAPDGGFLANPRAPFSDLLSTFTALWTLDQLGGLTRVNTTQALQFAQALEQLAGGFRAGLWDDGADIEYTFYGLGTLALLATL